MKKGITIILTAILTIAQDVTAFSNLGLSKALMGTTLVLIGVIAVGMVFTAMEQKQAEAEAKVEAENAYKSAAFDGYEEYSDSNADRKLAGMRRRQNLMRTKAERAERIARKAALSTVRKAG
jgi:hypothetical protein